jgi:hypothetical protein
MSILVLVSYLTSAPELYMKRRTQIVNIPGIAKIEGAVRGRPLYLVDVLLDS